MNKLAITFAVLIILGVGIEAALLFKIFTFPKNFNLDLGQKPSSSQAINAKNVAPIGGAVIIVKVTNNGFEPRSINAKLGDKIIWSNTTSGDVTVNSDAHPIHDLYPFLNLGEFKSGQTVRVILREQGKFSYHNHLNPSQTGTITVK